MNKSKEVLTDPNVEAVRARLLSRSAGGVKKYGTTTARGDLGIAEWLRHLQEELLDAAVYAEAAIAQRAEACASLADRLPEDVFEPGMLPGETEFESRARQCCANDMRAAFGECFGVSWPDEPDSRTRLVWAASWYAAINAYKRAALAGYARSPQEQLEIKRTEALASPLPPPAAAVVASDVFIISVANSLREDRYITLWTPDGRWDCYRFRNASRYSRQDVLDALSYYNDGRDTIAVPCDVVEALGVMTAAEDMLGGGEGLALRNEPAVWSELVAAAIEPPRHAVRPRVCSRAIPTFGKTGRSE